MVERQIEAEERLSDAAHALEDLAIGDRAPGLAATVAVGQEHRLRRGLRVVYQPVREPWRKRRQVASLAHEDRPVRPSVDENLGLPEASLAQRRRFDGGDFQSRGCQCVSSHAAGHLLAFPNRPPLKPSGSC